MKRIFCILFYIFWCKCSLGQIISKIDTVQLTIVHINSVGNYYAIYGIDSVKNKRYKILSIKDSNYSNNIEIGTSYLLRLIPQGISKYSTYGQGVTGEMFLAHQWGWDLYVAIEIIGLHYKSDGYGIKYLEIPENTRWVPYSHRHKNWSVPENVRNNKRELRKKMKIFDEQAKRRSEMPLIYESNPLIEP